MLNLLKYADARLGEPSTWASFAMLLGMAHVSVDPGVLHLITLWAGVFAACLGALLSEVGSKPAAAIASDMLATFVAAVKAMPADATKSAVTDAAKTAAILLLVCVGLAACGTPPPVTSSTPAPLAAVQNGLASVNAAVQGAATEAVSDVNIDLTAALAEAKAPTPPDTEFVNCATFLQTNGNALLGSLGAPVAPLCSGPVCAIAGFEKTRLALMGLGNALAPVSKAGLENACGPLGMSLQNQGATAAAEAAALLAVLGVKVAVPAALAVP